MIKAICFDLGDTLVAEETAVHDSSGQAITAHVIEGVFEVLGAIRREGYRIGMKSVWFRWNTRYSDTIDSSQEKPDFTINSLFELPGLLALM